MNIFKIFRIEDYENWSYAAIDKIIKCVDTSTSLDHFITCKRMIDQFILASIVSSNFNADELQKISKLLITYLNTKKSLTCG